MSASAMASAAHLGSAPGMSRLVMSARSSGSPEFAIDTAYPACSASRAMTGPTWPAPRTASRAAGGVNVSPATAIVASLYTSPLAD
jgi:hypothetical protein